EFYRPDSDLYQRVKEHFKKVSVDWVMSKDRASPLNTGMPKRDSIVFPNLSQSESTRRGMLSWQSLRRRSQQQKTRQRRSPSSWRAFQTRWGRGLLPALLDRVGTSPGCPYSLRRLAENGWSYLRKLSQSSPASPFWFIGRTRATGCS